MLFSFFKIVYGKLRKEGYGKTEKEEKLKTIINFIASQYLKNTQIKNLIKNLIHF